MIVGRAIGWLVVLAGLSVLIADVLAWQDTSRWAPIALGGLWSEIDQPSLDVTRAVIERDLFPALWDPIVVGLLRCWAFAALIGIGSTIIFWSRSRPRHLVSDRGRARPR